MKKKCLELVYEPAVCPKLEDTSVCVCVMYPNKACIVWCGASRSVYFCLHWERTAQTLMRDSTFHLTTAHSVC
jgi:hypothetical protein